MQLRRSLFDPLRRYGARLNQLAETSDPRFGRRGAMYGVMSPYLLVCALLFAASFVGGGVVTMSLAMVAIALGFTASMVVMVLGVRADIRRYRATGSPYLPSDASPPPPDPWLTQPHWPRQVREGEARPQVRPDSLRNPSPPCGRRWPPKGVG